MKNTAFTPIFILLCLVGLFSSCKKQDPTPENDDVVYFDIKNELDIAKKNLEDEQKQNDRVKKEMKDVVPQTGQIKNAQKLVTESNNNVELFKQRVKYFEISLEQRKIDVRKRYFESLTGGRPWPDEKEIADYKARLRLQRSKLDWEKKSGKIESTDPGKKDGTAAPVKK